MYSIAVFGIGLLRSLYSIEPELCVRLGEVYLDLPNIQNHSLYARCLRYNAIFPRGSIYTTIRELGPEIPYYRRNYGSQLPNGCICGPFEFMDVSEA